MESTFLFKITFLPVKISTKKKNLQLFRKIIHYNHSFWFLPNACKQEKLLISLSFPFFTNIQRTEKNELNSHSHSHSLYNTGGWYKTTAMICVDAPRQSASSSVISQRKQQHRGSNIWTPLPQANRMGTRWWECNISSAIHNMTIFS
jgi:hypothetical protein